MNIIILMRGSCRENGSNGVLGSQQDARGDFFLVFNSSVFFLFSLSLPPTYLIKIYVTRLLFQSHRIRSLLCLFFVWNCATSLVGTLRARRLDIQSHIQWVSRMSPDKSVNKLPGPFVRRTFFYFILFYSSVDSQYRIGCTGSEKNERPLFLCDYAADSLSDFLYMPVYCMHLQQATTTNLLQFISLISCWWMRCGRLGHRSRLRSGSATIECKSHLFTCPTHNILNFPSCVQ